MPSPLPDHECNAAHDAGDYGFARARDIAFDAVQSLWRRRKDSDMKQVDLAHAIARSPAWVNRSLRGPGNWTLRTLGELVQGMNGELEITVHGIEDALPIRPNFHAYADYEAAAVHVRVTQPSPAPNTVSAVTSTDQAQLFKRLRATSALADVS
jgi:hypothetical protein